MSQLREVPAAVDEMVMKRHRLAQLRNHSAEVVAEISRLEVELGNVVCAACGKPHVDRCLESLG